MAEPLRPEPDTSPDPLRVAVDATSLLDAHVTGVGRFTTEVLTRLADRPDVAPTAFALSWRGRKRLPAVTPAGARTARRPGAARPLRWLWSRVERPAVELWTGPVDVVHGPNFVVPPSRRAALVVTVHDLTCIRFPQLCTADTLRYPELIRRAIGWGAWIHTPSPAIADEVRDAFPVDPQRVVAIDNGAPAEPGGDAAEGRRLAGADRYVLSLGTVEPRKDLPSLVKAFGALAEDDPDLRLVVAGADGWGADALTAEVDRSPHGDRVVRLGWVDDEARGSLLRGAAVFAYPSVYEGFGLPPLEAMAVGTPVVATATAVLRYTVGDAGVLVAPGDVEALADGLRRALDDEDLRRRITTRGRANVDRFSWTRTTEELVELYRRAVMAV
jgi:glycosyltransferase involved in cell wall biosynthesis